MRRALVDFPLTADELNKMFGPSNELTIKSWDDRWHENVQRNLYMHPAPKPASKLITEVPNFHTVMVCGAGWTLLKLRPYAAQVPKTWGIVATDRSLSFLLDIGLVPSLVVTMDGNQEEQPRMQDAFERLGKLHPQVPVLVDLVACPTIVKHLKNPYFFRSGSDGTCKASTYLKDYLERNPDIRLDHIGHGGNVGSTCTIAAKFFLYARHVVLTGFNFSMCEGTENIDTWERVQVPKENCIVSVNDVYGRPTYTLANLHNYRTWQEFFCHQNDDIEWVNCNDGGYLGVHDGQANYKHFTYETIPQAIERLGDHGAEEH